MISFFSGRKCSASASPKRIKSLIKPLLQNSSVTNFQYIGPWEGPIHFSRFVPRVHNCSKLFQRWSWSQEKKKHPFTRATFSFSSSFLYLLLPLSLSLPLFFLPLSIFFFLSFSLSSSSTFSYYTFNKNMRCKRSRNQHAEPHSLQLQLLQVLWVQPVLQVLPVLQAQISQIHRQQKINCHQLKILGERLLKNSKLKECIAFIWGRVHTNQDGTWMEPVPNVHGKHQKGTRGGTRTRSWDARVSNCKYLNMNCAKMPEYK